jgi:myo-inositol 2-dehydrogenase / D-chiro-inositol 1-dehydrogenase
MPVRTGLIGLGVMGAEHARLLSSVVSGSDATAVFDVDRGRADAAAAATGARVMDDPMVLIKDDGVDAVVVASADHTHEQFVLACLAADKPVLCEKPLAPDVAGCLRIIDAETGAGRRLVSVGFMRRYDPGYRQLRSLVAGGELGSPLLLHCVHRNASQVGVPSTVLITGSAVHEIDIARWLLGSELASVTVHAPRPSRLAGGTQDPMLLLLQSTSGVLIDVEVFVNAGYGYDVRCELVGEHGTATLDAVAPVVLRSAAGGVGRGLPIDWRDRFGEAYRQELQDWVDGVAAGDPGRGASAWDGYVATAVADAGLRALANGDTQAVTLHEKPAIYP